MTDAHLALLRKKLDERNYQNLVALANPYVNAFVADTVELCAPATVETVRLS